MHYYVNIVSKSVYQGYNVMFLGIFQIRRLLKAARARVKARWKSRAERLFEKEGVSVASSSSPSSPGVQQVSGKRTFFGAKNRILDSNILSLVSKHRVLKPFTREGWEGLCATEEEKLLCQVQSLSLSLLALLV